MSLKLFHIVLMISFLTLMAFVDFWFFRHHPHFKITALAASFFLALGFGYLLWFLGKYRSL